MHIIDAPGGRKIHVQTVPSMGGIGFILASLFSLLIWMDLQQLAELRFVLSALCLMLFVGVRDDLVELTAWQKLGAQLVATYIVVLLADIRISSLYGFMGIHELPLLLSYGLTLFAIILITNAFNLIDGLDGLAGTVSMVVLFFLGWWFLSVDKMAFSMLSFTLAGGVLSFLVFNWHPAKLFMGDSGSLSLGFTLAVLVIKFTDLNGTMVGFEGFKFQAPLATSLALLIIPLYDTARVSLKRTLKGKSPMSPDKSHVHHFLMRGGLRHDQVTILLGTVSLLFISISFGGSHLGDHIMVPLVVLAAVVLGFRLDAITLSKVRKRVRETPPVLSVKLSAALEEMQRQQELEEDTPVGRAKKRKRISIRSEIIRRMDINDN